MKPELAAACTALYLGHVMEEYETIPFEDRTEYLLGVLQAKLQGWEMSRIQRLLRKAHLRR